jgi:hypothetical protein
MDNLWVQREEVKQDFVAYREGGIDIVLGNI